MWCLPNPFVYLSGVPNVTLGNSSQGYLPEQLTHKQQHRIPRETTAINFLLLPSSDIGGRHIFKLITFCYDNYQM